MAGTPIVICSGAIQKTIFINQEGDEVPDSGKHDAPAKPCLYTTSIYGSTPKVELPSIPVALADTYILLGNYIVPHRAFPDSHTPRGPPALA